VKKWILAAELLIALFSRQFRLLLRTISGKVLDMAGIVDFYLNMSQIFGR